MAHKLVRRAAAPALLTFTVVVLLVATGCGSATDVQGADTSPSAMMSGGTLTGAGTDLQTCSACAGGTAPQVYGKTQTVNGVQVVDIGVKNGFYSPNQFTVAAGMPVKVVFSGKATGCLAMPMFKSLEKKADFNSGEATLELGELKPGTYELTCGMEMTGGKIVAQ